jgi:hypothetical protein
VSERKQPLRRGDAVLIWARLVDIHPGRGLATVRIAEPVKQFGGRGFRADVIGVDAIADVDIVAPNDPDVVPALAAR